MTCLYNKHLTAHYDCAYPKEDGYDETLVPVDYATAGQIRDDLLYEVLIAAIPAGVTVTCIMDCCHSGTVLDLPYQFKADGIQTQMAVPANFDFKKLTAYAKKAQSLYNAYKTGDTAAMAAAAQAECCVLL